MLSPELLTRLYRRIQSRRVKVCAIAAMRFVRTRHLVIRMDTTNLCNLRCRMCYYYAGKRRKRQEMDLELFEKIAGDLFPRTRFLYLSCATEPLMNRSFAAFLDRTARYRVPFTSFCTNGMLLTEQVVDCAINAQLSEIIFSVDAATPETYEYIRRGAKWDVLLEKLDLLLSRKERANSQLPVGRMNFTCMQRNVLELPALIRVAAEHGIRNIHVRHLLAFSDDDQEMGCEEQMAYRKSFNEIADEAKAEAHRLKVGLFLRDPIPEKPATQAASSPSQAPRKREANPYCLIPWFHFIMKPTGDLRLCSVFPPFGNLREQSFKEIYNSPRMRELSKELLHRPLDVCSWKWSQEAYHVSPEQPEEPVKD